MRRTALAFLGLLIAFSPFAAIYFLLRADCVAAPQNLQQLTRFRPECEFYGRAVLLPTLRLRAIVDGKRLYLFKDTDPFYIDSVHTVEGGRITVKSMVTNYVATADFPQLSSNIKAIVEVPESGGIRVVGEKEALRVAVTRIGDVAHISKAENEILEEEVDRKSFLSPFYCGDYAFISEIPFGVGNAFVDGGAIFLFKNKDSVRVTRRVDTHASLAAGKEKKRAETLYKDERDCEYSYPLKHPELKLPCLERARQKQAKSDAYEAEQMKRSKLTREPWQIFQMNIDRERSRVFGMDLELGSLESLAVDQAGWLYAFGGSPSWRLKVSEGGERKYEKICH